MARIEVGPQATAAEGAVAVGEKAFAEKGAVAIGDHALARKGGIAIGPKAYALENELTFAVGLKEFLRITEDGDVYVRGQLVGRDQAVLQALRLLVHLNFAALAQDPPEEWTTLFSALERLIPQIPNPEG